jgi:folylpolyglutamate synthase
MPNLDLWRLTMSIELTLDRIRILASHLKPYTRPTCHIAGTNGKGSVTALLSSILRSSSPPLSVGRFNSPHLVSLYDCIAINNRPVAPNVYAKARGAVEKADRDHNVGASSFELLTLTALLVFEEAELDIVVIEVGMGGRLDATNVISDECILVSALTAVDLDHQAFLGPTVEDIATEKAGIARSGKPFVIGKQKDLKVTETVQHAVKGQVLIYAQAPAKREWDEVLDGPKPPQISFSSSDLQASLSQPVEIKSLPPFSKPILTMLPLFGDHQLDNLGTAVSMISTLLTDASCAKMLPHIGSRITPETVARGIQTTKWAGRLSFHTVAVPGTRVNQHSRSLTILADGAHNPASSATLGNFIKSLLDLRTPQSQSEPPITISITYILALSHSPPKKPSDTLAPLFSSSILGHASNVRVKMNVALVEFTPPAGMPWIKPIPPSELRRVVLEAAPGVPTWEPDGEASIDNHLSAALAWAATRHEQDLGQNGEGLVVLAGSLYLVADLYRSRNLQ